ncbi:MAG: hypothetical protein IPL61_27540 [Myxococcales bacterium]|nr:hypothetical protein [Myxococcales bacterium]
MMAGMRGRGLGGGLAATLVAGIVGLSTACGERSDRAGHECGGPAGADVQIDVAPGLYRVEVEQGGERAAVWWPSRIEDRSTATRDSLVMVGPDRWLRVTTAAGKINVQECWAGGTPEGGCDEIGPPRSGTMTLTLDGSEVARLALFAPVDETIAMAGCPTRRHGQIR